MSMRQIDQTQMLQGSFSIETETGLVCLDTPFAVLDLRGRVNRDHVLKTAIPDLAP